MASHIMALKRIVKEVKKHHKASILLFIDLKKAFESVHRNIMLEIFKSYGVPTLIINAIKAMYINTLCLGYNS